MLFRFGSKPTYEEIIKTAEENGLDLEDMAREGFLEIFKMCGILEIVPTKNFILRKFK